MFEELATHLDELVLLYQAVALIVQSRQDGMPFLERGFEREEREEALHNLDLHVAVRIGIARDEELLKKDNSVVTRLAPPRPLGWRHCGAVRVRRSTMQSLRPYNPCR
jgi:hypothetical protein